jgi:hypothetical protein
MTIRRTLFQRASPLPHTQTRNVRLTQNVRLTRNVKPTQNVGYET